MIKKRYLMILSVAVVSVLLGSLFYSNTPQAQKLHTHKDSVKITVLSPREFKYMEGLASPYPYGGVVIDSPMPFEFSPKGTFVNVTDLWISVVISGDRRHDGVLTALRINQGTWIAVNYGTYQKYPYAVSIHIQDENMHWIHIGNNMVEFNASGMNFYEVTIFVEYTYQAR